MNYDWLRNKTDSELDKWFSSTIGSKIPFCVKCGRITNHSDRRTINVSIYDKRLGQKSKKLCTLCNECYSDLLDYLSISDVI